MITLTFPEKDVVNIISNIRAYTDLTYDIDNVYLNEGKNEFMVKIKIMSDYLDKDTSNSVQIIHDICEILSENKPKDKDAFCFAKKCIKETINSLKKGQTIVKKAMLRINNNQKLNNICNDVYQDLLSMCDTVEDSIREIKHYKKEFGYETDYNLYRYGNLIINTCDVVNLFLKNGYSAKTTKNDINTLDRYKYAVRITADYILEHENDILHEEDLQTKKSRKF